MGIKRVRRGEANDRKELKKRLFIGALEMGIGIERREEEETTMIGR